MRILLLSLIISSLLSGCSYEKKLSRAKRHLANLVQDYPELVQRDTIYTTVHDTVIGVQHDTIVQSGITHDTITIHDKQLTVKYFNNGKTVYIKGKCDTVFKEIKVPVVVNSVNPVQEVHVMRWWDWFAYVIAILAILFIILSRLIPRRNS